MYRIDNATSSGTPPAIPAAGTEAYFQDTSGSGGTIVPAWFIHMIQEEVRQVVTDAGLTPDKTDNGQLSEAVSTLISNNNSSTSAVSSSYVGGVEYQNTSDKKLMVIAYASSGTYVSMQADIGSASPPATTVTAIAGAVDDANTRAGNMTFIVPPNWYFKITITQGTLTRAESWEI